MHPYPTFVYVLEGAIDVEMAGGEFRATKLEIRSSRWSTPGHNSKNKGTTPARYSWSLLACTGSRTSMRP